mgnify:CR=1 FL=1
MFCMNCGKPLPDGSKFCPHCGTPVPSSAEGSSSTEGLSLDDLLKKVNEKKEEKIYPIFCSPEDDSELLRPFHDGERGVYAYEKYFHNVEQSSNLIWTAAILNTMSGRWGFSACSRS